MPFEYIVQLSRKFRNRHFLILDLFIVLISPIIALTIRLEGNVDFNYYFPDFLYLICISSVIKLCIFYLFGLYSQLWIAASVDELAKLVFAGIFSVVIEVFLFHIPIVLNSQGLQKFPLSLPLLDGAIAIFFVSLSRFSIRLFERANQRLNSRYILKNIGVVGAGQSGITITREFFRHSENGKVVVFIDDDPLKQNLKILGIPVEGPLERLPEIIRSYQLDKVVIVMPTASGIVVRKVTNECIQAGIEVLTTPALNEIIDGKVSFQQLRKVQVEDLLRREPIETDILKVKDFVKGKRILVTGAGGSIGSELCRQIITFCPEGLILVGHGENSIFNIEQELAYKLDSLKCKVRPKIISRIVDIRFKENLARVFSETKPEIIFHAAAHKHVPLMEINPTEAIFNNVLGTQNLVDLSIESNVSGFILISTDKAVNPSSIMGTTKRIAEIITLNAAQKYNKRYGAVRFGNVLGSSGSVLQTFKKQALVGGPITITHPDIIRYFMTIPEAVQLVLQASVLTFGGEVFVFDMGDPVKIIDLARDFIRLSGLKEGIDINIEYCGLRPGEKLYEELFIKGENYIRTGHQKILIASNASKILGNNIEQKITNLISESRDTDYEKVLYLLKSIVPEYHPTNHNFIEIKKTIE